MNEHEMLCEKGRVEAQKKTHLNMEHMIISGKFVRVWEL
jgi:hypothetical protein